MKGAFINFRNKLENWRTQMPELYPLRFEPVLKHYIWGGRHLADLGRALGGETAAESWEIAAHPDGMTRVINGRYAGQTLPELVKLLGVDLLGTRNDWALAQGKFPLMVKLLDANQNLSVQVHPDDGYARANLVNELGKYEMWVVLSAQPDAAIIYGLAEEVSPETFRQAVEDGSLEPLLNRLPIRAGDHICVPAGTLHAILAGAVLVEIQQNSNATFRVYDWNRVGRNGKPRDLHLEQALQVIRFDQVGLGLPDMDVLESANGFTRERLCRNPYFTTERLLMEQGGTFKSNCDGASLEIWGVIDGKATVAGQELDAVGFVVLPAAMGRFEVTALEKSTLLRTYVE
jgi:mannose-6-phosphate isomerase